jgi:colanic acid/amylovoran biosynthesis glycosyltransferase
MKIGLIMPTTPNYSETFIHNKINGLLNHGFKVSLFVASKSESKVVPLSIPVYCQVKVNNKLYLLLTFITTFILHPLTCFRFLSLEKVAHGDWRRALKNLIINSHIIGKSLDWLHFGFTTMGLCRENIAQAIGAKSAVSFRGFDIGLYPYQHPGCYNLLWRRIDKVHTISDDLAPIACAIFSLQSPIVVNPKCSQSNDLPMI